MYVSDIQPGRERKLAFQASPQIDIPKRDLHARTSRELIPDSEPRAKALGNYGRVSNLKYESVRIDSKTVVFVRANPGKKETTDGSGSYVIFFRDWCTACRSGKLRKMARDQKFKFTVTISFADH